MIEIIYFSLSLSLIFFSMLGYGLIFNNSFFKNDLFFTLLTGYFFIGLMALIAHFFLPINYILSSVILLGGLILFFLKISNFNLKKIIKKTLILILISLILLIYTDHPIDTNMYHHPYVSYLKKEKIIFGIAEIQFRFGHISFMQYVQAITSNKYIHELTIAAPNLILYSFFIFFCKDVITNKKKNKILYLVTILIVSFILIKFSRYREFGNDILPFLFSSYFFIYIVDEILQPNKNRKKIIILAPLFAVFIFTHKISYLFVFLIFISIIKKNDVIEFLRNKIIISLCVVLSFGWFLKNVIVTSCLAYPIVFTCFESTNWYLTGVANPTNASWLTELWSKDFITNENWKELDLDKYINTLAWIPNWLENHFIKILEKLSPLFIIIFLLSTFLLTFQKNEIKNFYSIRLLNLLFLILFGLLMWFFNAPIFRYGSFYLVSFVIIIFILIFKNIINRNSFNDLKKLKIIFLISVIFFTGKNFSRIIENKSDFFPETIISSNRYKEVKSGELTILKPIDNGVCYFSRQICSHELRNGTIFVKKNKYYFLESN